MKEVVTLVLSRSSYEFSELVTSFWPSKLGREEEEKHPTTEYQCPITLEKCIDPVIANDGHTYERSAIMQVLLTSGVSPLTRSTLDHFLHPNTELRKRCPPLIPSV